MLTLSGDFHIGSNLSFNQLQTHENLQMCFHIHGYNITFSGYQSADIFRIGLPTYVHGFTFWDLYSYIMDCPEWKATLSDYIMIVLKGDLTHVSMTNVDHPNLDIALKDFHLTYDGKTKNLSNHIALFIASPLEKHTWAMNGLASSMKVITTLKG
jgi:hypothetical protein